MKKDNLIDQLEIMRWFSKYKIYHILFWLAYFLFWTYFSQYNFGSTFLGAVLATSIYFVGQAGVGYSSIYFLVPRYFFTRKYLVFSSLVLSAIILGSLFITFGMTALFHTTFTKGGSGISFGVYFIYSLIAVFFSTLLFIAAKVIKERAQAQKMNIALEKEKTEHELKFLKSQINPHFLFNAINSIYVLIKKDPDLAAATLAQFSDMLRYQLYECNFPEVPIEKEVEYLNNYIELEKLRKGMSLSIDYKVDPNTHNFVISPLLIIPFVENAFKHVSSFADKRNFIGIELNYQSDLFKLMVRNSVDNAELRQTENPVGGIGQDNTRRRLNLIYPGRHELIIEPGANTYFVSLTIQIP